MTRARDIADVGYKDELVDDTTPQLGSNLDAQTFDITNVGNVGIGTTSPAAQLHVKNSSGNSTSILGQYGTGTRAEINAFANQVELRAYNGTNDVMSFKTGSTERMRIDSSGRVTMPYQPAFIATNGASIIPHSTVVIGTTTDLNVGNHYSTSTGRFTAPVAGVYRFSITGLYTLSGTNATWKGIWRKNGSNVGTAYEYQGSGLNGTYNTIGTSTVLIYCNANDYVDLLNGDTTLHSSVHCSGIQTKLCGELVA